MKLTSPLDRIQQAGATGTAVKSVTPCFCLRLVTTCGYRIDASIYFTITNFHTELNSQEKVIHDMNSMTLKPYTTFV